ncbi:hypothetical protein WMF38_12510 [Sorangium sp. So ce118]
MPDTTNDPPLSLERFGEVSAYLIHFKGVDQAVVLDRLAVRPEDLLSARKKWTDVLSRDVEREETSLALVMAKAYRRTKERLDAERPDLASIGQWSRHLELHDDETSKKDDTSTSAQAPPVASTSAASSEGSPTVPAPGPPPAVRADEPRFAMGSGTPGPLSPAVEERATGAPRSVGPDDFDGTLPVNVMSPFAQVLPAAWTNAARPAPSRAHEGRMETALPFRSPGASALPPTPPGSPPPDGAPAAPSAPHAPMALTLKQYASLCVDCELDHAGRAAIARRYGLTPEQHAHLDVQFRWLFAVQPAQLDAFRQACSVYRAWCEQNARRR